MKTINEDYAGFLELGGWMFLEETVSVSPFFVM
jgi:hypothetical protein